MDSQSSCLSFFTTNHRRHHTKWVFAGSGHFPQVCLACLTETIEDKQALNTRKKKSLAEILRLLSREASAVQILRENIRVASHLSEILFSLVQSENEGLAQLAIETTAQLTHKMQVEETARGILVKIEQSVENSKNTKTSYPLLLLLGKLLELIPPLSGEIVEREKLWHYCLQNGSFPVEDVRTALLYIYLGICKQGEIFASIRACDRELMLVNTCEVLRDSKALHQQINALAVLRFYCTEKSTLLSITDSNHPSLLSEALKKVILHSNEGIQVGGIQCLQTILATHSSKELLLSSFLANGLVEFLFEALDSKSDTVIGSVFCCLSELCQSQAFYESNYSVYGLTSLIHALNKSIQLKNPETIRQGLHVLGLIVTKQPGSVPLFTNGTIFEQCLVVVEESFKAMEYKVLHEAAHLLKTLLRIEHVPQSVPLSRVTCLLLAVASVLKRFSAKSIAFFKSMKSDLAQDLLCVLLKALRRGLNFAEEHSARGPSREEALLAAISTPSSSKEDKEASSHELKVLLSRVIDEVVIPAVMVNFEVVTSPDVFKTFFKILTNVLSDKHSVMQRFAQKLADASFVRLCMSLNGRFCRGNSNADLFKVLVMFLKYFTRSLSEDSNEATSDLFYERLSTLPSCGDEVVIYLSQCSSSQDASTIADKNLMTVQCVCIDLLKLSLLHGDPLLPEKAMLSALDTFITLHRNLSLLPRPILKNLLWLFARCSFLHKARPSLTTSETILESYVLALKKDEFLNIYSHDEFFLKWVFSIDNLGKAFGQCALELWIAREVSSQTKIEIDWGFMRSSRVAFTCLLAVLFSSDSETSCMIVHIVHLALRHGSDLPGAYVSEMNECFRKLFLSYHGQSMPDHLLVATLEILSLTSTGINPDVKLLHHVMNIVTDKREKPPEISLKGVNYFNLLLLQTVGDTEVAAILLNSKRLMEWLQQGLTCLTSLNITSCSHSQIKLMATLILLVKNLVTSQCLSKITTNQRLTLNKENFIEMINTGKSFLLKVACILLWESLFRAQEKVTCVAFGEDDGEPMACQPIISFSDQDRRLIFVYLQNGIAHESEAVQLAAVSCMEAMTSRVSNPTPFVNNQWNGLLLDSLLFKVKTEKLTATFLRFCAYLLHVGDENTFRNKTLQFAVALIVREIPCVTSSDPYFAPCVALIRDICTKAMLSVAQIPPLLTWLQCVKPLASVSKPEIVRLENVVLELSKSCVLEDGLLDQVIDTLAANLTQSNIEQ
ncbi:predicted protein [Nematostella vectensis]|uniref:Meiosis inhibitor protein 1 n=2 Tax=Nematostella vectensis TaxID=45351 RepID=A7RW76_NEMVE|nr:predicted protein [Nematostella vectensis]|eukprot:XP_001636281.1 predicted protein [Nematostella vectensis]